MTIKVAPRVAALTLAFTLSPLHAASPPGVLNHQGRIAVSGTNYTGTGYFKFALVNEAGTATFWSNDGTSINGAVPTAAVAVNVSQGHYALGLGDTAVANMAAEIPPSVFTGNTDVRLRVWFSANGTTFEQLTPDRRITAAGYALTAGAVADPSFLGTTTNTALNFSANNLLGLRLQPGLLSGSGTPNLIGGDVLNTISEGSVGSVIAGGGYFAANSITGNTENAVISGGEGNTASGARSFVGGGSENSATGTASVVVGGDSNSANSFRSVVGGGGNNTASAPEATVPGGSNNTASGELSFAAGYRAKAVNRGTFVWSDDATETDFTSTDNNQFLVRATGGVGINKNNPTVALDVNGTVKATAFQGNLIGGNAANSITGNSVGSVISGGGSITANSIIGASNAFIGGGQNNSVSGKGAVVLGGESNIASGTYSFAGGYFAQAAHPGAFVWADVSENTLFSSTAHDQFNVRAAGGVRLFTGGTGLKLDTDSMVISGNAQASRFHSAANFDFNSNRNEGTLIEHGTGESAGIHLDSDYITMWSAGDQGRLFRILDEDSMASGVAAAEKFYIDGAGGFFSRSDSEVTGEITCVAVNITSDRDAKEQFAPVNTREVLDKITRMPISEWQYKSQAGARHIGPMAQDFRDAFALGRDEKHITSVDADGVALAAIQGLNAKLEEQLREKDLELQQITTENQSLAERLTAIERALGLKAEKSSSGGNLQGE